MKGIRRNQLQSYLEEFMWRENFDDEGFQKTLSLIIDFNISRYLSPSPPPTKVVYEFTCEKSGL